MLPTKGYFQDIECPYSNSYCGRPYCHFRHKKKLTDTVEELVNDPEKEDSNAIPVYNPTPKSELANIQNHRSHIPISYVPDIVFRSERKARPVPKFEKPTYKPTPLSILSSASRRSSSVTDENGDNFETIKEIKQNMADMEYDPAESLHSTEDIDFGELDTEFAIIDEIIRSDSYKKKKLLKSNTNLKTTLGETTKTRLDINSVECELKDKNHQNNALENKKIQDNSSLERNKKAAPPKEKEKERTATKSEKTSVKCKGQSDERKKLILTDRSDKNSDLNKEKTKDKSEESSKQKKSDSKSKDSLDKGKSLDRYKEKDDKKDKEKSEKNSEKVQKTSSRDKHRKEELKDRQEKKSRSKHTEKSPSHTKSRSRSRERVKSEERKKKSEKSQEQKNKERTVSKQRSRDKESSSDRRKSKEDEEQHKSKSKKDENEKSKQQKDNTRSKERSQDRKSKTLSEDRHKSKDKYKESTDKNKTKRKHDHKKTDKSIEKNNKHKSKNVIEDEISSGKSASDSEYEPSVVEPIDDLTGIDIDEDEDQTMLECYKIFYEYKPSSKSELVSDAEMFSPEHSSRDSTDLGQNEYTGKKRVAHGTTERTYSQLHPPQKPKSTPTPGQALSNRYRLANLAKASREQELLINEVQQSTTLKRSAPTLLEAARARKIRKVQPVTNHVNTNVVDDILKGLNNKTVPLPRPKIAPAQNVSLMAKAKERISKISQVSPKTIAHSQKGPRVAHVPDASLADIPDVLQADRSKLPVNVRTRFLTMLADECVKLYISKEEAFSRALNEEFACYEKCNALATYRNSAMLAVNRLRKEIQERNSNGLGLIGVGEDDGKGSNSEFSSKRFYDKIKAWTLTEEELDIHGYPRESEECQGKAYIKNPKYVPLSNLGDNERSCSRCHKMYMVDDEGWPLYDEECVYHPLKKRTIRGEQTYLCCRSGDETGCATSDTHVSEGFNATELEGYQTTMEPERDDDPRSYAVYALDCEMCYTTKGLELTRVTIVDSDCKTVYESLVKPLNPIIDYNTRFSGITKEQMNRTSTSILQVQANILHLCNSKTILVGHSLESDMKALKIVHESIVDTSVLFPHKMGLPHKRALRALASEYLRKIIQNDVSGHDSAEDAVTCMELLKWKLKEEAKLRSPK